MTLEDLRVFLAVCKLGNLSAVARDLSCSQSAVSQHVKRLEAEIGLSLVERRPRGVILTDAGRLLRDAVRAGLGQIDTAVRQTRDLAEGSAGEVRVTTGATTVRHFMTGGIHTFRQRYPRVRLEFRTRVSSRDCLAAITADEADLAFVTIGAPVPGVEVRQVVELPWSLAVPADDPLAGATHLELAGLEGIPHIRLPENSTARKQLDTRLAEHGITAPTAASAADWDTVVLLVELGVGRAVVPTMPGWNPARHPDLRLVPIPALRPLAAGWAYRRWDALSPQARTFADTITADLGGADPAR
ncbi:LysR family transcriptional regulator [Amycolatopsis nigrescens]|uniref:LysR family transcriptional regulator n=1 Tax=Amycolatopsis nigrescens TaxID=381445 RepID=UPI0004776FE3|nr:LysR family transcriptional regulator [Amycolatopsis nigrescens]